MEQEKIEQRAALWVLNDYGIFSSVALMLDQLSWPTLQTHCKVSRLLTIIAQIVYHQLSLIIPPYYLPATRPMRRYHLLHYILSYSSTMTHQNSYFSRMISNWNKRPIHIIEVTDTDTLKIELLFVL